MRCDIGVVGFDGARVRPGVRLNPEVLDSESLEARPELASLLRRDGGGLRDQLEGGCRGPVLKGVVRCLRDVSKGEGGTDGPLEGGLDRWKEVPSDSRLDERECPSYSKSSSRKSLRPR